jgi:hypothetical protein
MRASDSADSRPASRSVTASTRSARTTRMPRIAEMSAISARRRDGTTTVTRTPPAASNSFTRRYASGSPPQTM